jgi:hypothetical protein
MLQKHSDSGFFSHLHSEDSLSYIELIAATNNLRRDVILNFGTHYVFYGFKPVKVWLTDYHKGVIFSFLNGLHFENSAKKSDIQVHSKNLIAYLEQHYLPFKLNHKDSSFSIKTLVHHTPHAFSKRATNICGINRSAYPNKSARHHR